jgi:hypothetical protein
MAPSWWCRQGFPVLSTRPQRDGPPGTEHLHSTYNKYNYWHMALPPFDMSMSICCFDNFLDVKDGFLYLRNGSCQTLFADMFLLLLLQVQGEWEVARACEGEAALSLHHPRSVGQSSSTPLNQTSALPPCCYIDTSLCSREENFHSLYTVIYIPLSNVLVNMFIFYVQMTNYEDIYFEVPMLYSILLK